MRHDDLVRMINQIAQFFDAVPASRSGRRRQRTSAEVLGPVDAQGIDRRAAAARAAPASAREFGAERARRRDHRVIARADITGLILCGGAGTRFDGRDKPLELLDGSPLFAHVRERLLPQVARIVISCNRNIDAYARFGDALVVDEEPQRGPLGGVLAGLMRADDRLRIRLPGRRAVPVAHARRAPRHSARRRTRGLSAAARRHAAATPVHADASFARAGASDVTSTPAADRSMRSSINSARRSSTPRSMRMRSSTSIRRRISPRLPR